MGRRQTLLLLLVLSFTSFVSAQTVSVTFLDEWGAVAARVLEESRVVLRVIDPAANTSPGRDSVSVDLSTTISMETDFTSLLETGEATGVFEGEVDLTTDFYLNYLEDEEHLLTYPRTYPPEALDTAAATYNGVSASVEAAPSLTDLLDESGASPAGFALGETVRVRVRDQYSDKNVGAESTLATLSLSGGDSESLLLFETGGDTGVFETSIPSGPGAPVPNDGRIQAAVGETVSVVHADANGFSSSSDSAAVTAASVRLIDEEGRPADVYLENLAAIARVVDRAADLDAFAFDTVTATVSMQRSGDVETLTLRETGRSTGVFEGKMALSTGYQYSGNGRLDAHPVTGPTSPFDTVTVSYSGSSDSAGLTGSITRLFDTSGQEIGLLPVLSSMLVRVETANDSGFIDTTVVEVRSLVTGDVEILELRETGPASNVFEGEIEVYWSPAPGPGDGYLMASVGDTLRVDHFDANGYTRSRAEATAVRSSVRFVDEAGQPVSILLEGSTARVRVHDRVSQPTPPPTEVESLLGRDSEPLSLAPAALSYWFEGSIPLDIDNYYGTPNDGELTVGGNTTPVNQPDVVTATSHGASAEAVTAPAILEIVNGPVAAAGSLLRIRATAPLANQSPAYANYLMVQVRSQRGGDVRSVYLMETGADTDTFEGTIGTRTGPVYDPDSIYVEPSDTVTALFNAYSGMGGAAATIAIAPMTVELVDGGGQPVSTYLFGETVHVRVTETAANADPGTAEIISATVQAWRRADDRPDVEIVDLFETGPDTGVFTGSLPTELIYFQSFPSFDNGSLELLDIYPPYGDLATVTATRGGASGTARMEDSRVRITNAAGEDYPVVVSDSQGHVWLLRPAGNTTAGIDFETVEIWTHDSPNDFETLTLTETGGDTGIFRGSIPVLATVSPVMDNGILEGPTGTLVQVDKRVTVTLRSVDTALIARLLFSPPEAQDDFASTAEGTPVTIDVTANDDDDDGDDLGVTAVTQGAKGSVSFTPAGATVTYTPNVGAIGSDSFTYTVSDFGGNVDGNTDTATVYVTINAAEGPPNAVDDSATTSEDTPVNVAVKANDTDPDGDPLTVVSVTQGANGSAAIQGDGTVTYTPNPDFQGTDTFTYTISDGSATDTATVTVTIGGVNDPPDAVDDSATTNEDTIVIVPVLANDVDPDSGLTITARTQGTKGVVTILGDGTIRYTPNANANGADSFTYTISDGSATDTASVAVTITPVNDAPVAWNDSATTPEDTAITIAILANDTDAEGDPITAGNLGAVANGTLVLNPDGTVTYTPNPDFRGFENFTYTASDPSGAQSTATVHIEITPVNDPPTAVNDAATTNEDTAKNFDVASNDTDPDGDNLIVIAVTQGAKGSVVINNSPSLNGKYVIYTPNANANGSDSFTYTISDGKGGTATGSVAMTITPVNDVPRANADSATTSEDTPITLDPRVNDTDPDGDPLTITSASNPNRGSTVINVDGTVTYTPDPNLNGSDSFLYTISDGNGGTWSATVSMTVTPVNDPPDARNDLPFTPEDTPITISVLSNDVDPENNTLTVTALTQPSKGTAVLNANNTITYTPNLNTNGSDSFTYTISDGNGGTDTATVNVSVSTVNDPPVAVTDSATVAEEGTVTVAVAANDTDPENSALTVTAVTQGAHGTVTLLAGNQVSYQPAANYSGPDTFTYTIRDPGNLTSTGTVNVTVTPVNDPPVAVDDSTGMPEDSGIAYSVLANDTDIDGDTLTVVAVTQSANGSVSTNGTLVFFSPNANYYGTAFFTYTIRDAGGVERTANVTISVNPVNDPPLAGPDTAVTNENTPVTVSVLANDADVDGGALSVSAVTQGSNGTVATNGVTVTYTPAAGFSGTDSFTYNVSDGVGGTATGLVTVTVDNVNGAPVANPDSGSTREGVAVIIPVLANDTDADGDTLTVTAVESPGVLLPDNTVRYTPAANFTGTVIFSYAVSDGQGGTANGQVTVVVGEALERVAILATNSVALRTGSDVLSGDVIVNQAGAGPFLNGAELSIAGSVTAAANWDVEADSLTVALGAVIGSDISYNQLTNLGTLNGLQRTPLALPVFPALPAFLAATPGTTNINVAQNGTRTLAPGSYLDLVVGRKGTVTFTGGTYHFRSITVDREAKLLFSAASQVRVQQKLSTKNTTTIGPAAGAPIDASSIVFYVAGINGTTGALTATPKAVEIGASNTVSINLYAPNGTTWLQDGTLATGAFLGKDVDLGVNAQVTLDSAFQ